MWRGKEKHNSRNFVKLRKENIPQTYFYFSVWLMAELFYTVRIIIHSCSQVSYCPEYNQDWDLRDWKSNEKSLGGHKLKVMKKEKICRVDPTKEQTKEIIRCTMSRGEGKRKATFLKCVWSPRLVKVLEWNKELWEWDFWWKLFLPSKCI